MTAGHRSDGSGPSRATAAAERAGAELRGGGLTGESQSGIPRLDLSRGLAQELGHGTGNAQVCSDRRFEVRPGLATARGGAGSPVCRALGPRERYGLLQLE